MKFGQLIQCNMRNFFLEKSHTKCGGETNPRPFSGNYNWAYLWINNLKFYTVCFYCMASWRLSKYNKTKLQTTYFYLILSSFLKNKEVWNWSPCLIFCIIFEEKHFSCYVILIDQVSLSGYLHFVRYWAICVLQLFVNQVALSWILELTLHF